MLPLVGLYHFIFLFKLAGPPVYYSGSNEPSLATQFKWLEYTFKLWKNFVSSIWEVKKEHIHMLCVFRWTGREAEKVDTQIWKGHLEQGQKTQRIYCTLSINHRGCYNAWTFWLLRGVAWRDFKYWHHIFYILGYIQEPEEECCQKTPTY